ncbi:MAG TPA: dienelactone hydrolase family protein [Solirubrobacteraceae bacterium]|nr:dienelactone hydrolase family protein [Solirubrobacteraceae bacterium]
MSAETIEVNTPRGRMPVHVHRPSGNPPSAVVVLYMDAPGIRPALHDHAERLAAAGYIAVLPDLYYQFDPADRPSPERLAAGDPHEFKRMQAAASRVRDDDVVEDTTLMLEALPGRPSGPWGCVGFCMGGRFGLRGAEAFGADLSAASLLHPSRLVTDQPDSPHLSVDRVTGALYLGFGEADHVTPVSTIPPLREQLVRGGVEHRIEVFPDADHGYTMPDRPAYNHDAAERAWAGTLELLRERL